MAKPNIIYEASPLEALAFGLLLLPETRRVFWGTPGGREGALGVSRSNCLPPRHIIYKASPLEALAFGLLRKGSGDQASVLGTPGAHEGALGYLGAIATLGGI